MPFILNTAIYSQEDVADPKEVKDLRRASRNMRMAQTAVKKVLLQFPTLIQDSPSSMAAVLGTGHGELESTKDFLKFYREQGSARPILFQNSLHNSTLGFLSQYFGFTGPAITHSDRYLSAEKALETAMLLLEDNQALYCLVIGIDTIIAGFEEPVKLLYPPQVQLGEGCGVLLLANEAGLKRLPQVTPKAQLKHIHYSPKENPSFNWMDSDPYYDADAIEKLAVHLQKNNPSDCLELVKPNGEKSVIELMLMRGQMHVPH